MRKHTAYYLILTTLLLMLVAATSCRDEIEMPIYDYGLVGADVTVEVPVTLPAMDVQSRASLSQTQLNTVNSLWIRTYSTGGAATSPWYKITETTQDNEPVTHSYNIRSKSGPSYIVAVANVENMGVSRTDPDNQRPLSELLEEADTWAKFLDIAVLSPTTDTDVNAAPVPVTMSGCYSTDPIGAQGVHPQPGEWAGRGFASVFIPAANNELVKLNPADGVIHLRRVVSHVTFNLKAGEKVKISPQSYTVVNVPVCTWLYEHDPAQPGLKANPGDWCEKEEDAGKYYATPPLYTSQYFKNVTNDGSCSFDFWQGENKHNALPGANCDEYSKREKEAKTQASETQAAGLNTGLYTSLTGETWTPNNMASYVVVRCDVEYRDPLKVDNDGKLDENGSLVTRTGEAEFVIHLGFLNNDPADFNCFRNVDYTYNVTVNGVDDIRVEAFGEETVPGVEGLVSDVEHTTIKLDCHYNSFNIQLSRQELTNNFDYLITTWDYGQRKEFSKKNPPTAADDQYIGWVELRPTTGEEVLAEYKPRTGTYADGRTFTLQDATGAHSWATNDERFSPSGWYTVFVAEYTYEDKTDERTNGQTPNWQRYINQNDRWFHIRVVRSISSDTESTYARSKYAISQSSIQTYYSDRVFTPAEGDISAATAIGVERVNETEGLNLRSSLTYTNNIGVIAGTTSDATNGRFNVWTWIDSRPKNDGGNVLWTELVETDKVMKIKEVPDGDNQNGPKIYAHTAPLAKLKQFTGTLDASNDDPQRNSVNREDFIEAIAACMSRNRDNNGNGVIDKEELRWYVPATGKYLRMVLGSNSIVPLMNYNSLTTQKLPHADNKWNTRYHYYTSDHRILWAMESLSTSMYRQWGTTPPWQVRCIRNLGSNLTEITRGEKVTTAYERDKDNPRQVNMTYYDMNNVRVIKYSGNGNGPDQMPVHLITDEYNNVYKSFEYWESIDSYTFPADIWKGSNVGTFQLLTDFFNTNPCKIHDTTEKSGWRLPNMKELAIMRNLGGLFNNNDNIYREYIYSCSVSYFDYNNENGGKYQPGKHRFMASRPDGLTQLDAVYNYPTIYFRCVRDVD